MMALTREEVEHVADLAKLGLTGEEVEMYREQLSAILEYAAVLQSLDTEAIPPTASVLPSRNVMRQDEPAASLSQEEALSNAPFAAEGHFRVKAILG
jgi:aspartyl-tRNA(Asn)/glutamyl-tRNA(Gln) amidotransferase subunit C